MSPTAQMRPVYAFRRFAMSSRTVGTNFHQRLIALFGSSFVFGNGLLFALCLVVVKHSLHASVIPALRKFRSFAHSFLRLRRS